jgi:iron(II)-dependent oxidoreductase
MRGIRYPVLLALAFLASAATLRAPAEDGSALVPAGAFLMGSSLEHPAEAPAHRLFLPSFRIDRHKATNLEVAAFLNAKGLKSAEGEDDYDWDDPDARIHRVGGRFVHDPGFEQHPAVELSWFGARDYCAWRGKRLPTEAEWEKAARGDDGRRYPWGNASPTPERAVYGRAYNATQPVDSAPEGASPYGVHGMVGNLREWTGSQYRPYPYRPDDGREGAERRATRVIRGASHDDGPGALRVTIRHSYQHSGTARGHHHVGVRCAASLS